MELDIPCLADKIAEPRPDMNIKVAAFTVSENYINTQYETDEQEYEARLIVLVLPIYLFIYLYDIHLARRPVYHMAL